MTFGYNFMNTQMSPFAGMYSELAGRQQAINSIMLAQQLAMPTPGAGDCGPAMMDYPLYGYPAMCGPSIFSAPMGTEMMMYSAGRGIGSFLGSPFRAIGNAFYNLCN